MKDRIIPRAVDFFTGKPDILEMISDGYDNIDDEDEDEDEDEEDEDVVCADTCPPALTLIGSSNS